MNRIRVQYRHIDKQTSDLGIIEVAGPKVQIQHSPEWDLVKNSAINRAKKQNPDLITEPGGYWICTHQQP